MTTAIETVVPLPLTSIAMSSAPNRQIRDVRDDDVLALTETDPTTWDAITVRPWPVGEPYPLDEEDRPYQLVAGYHRISAARKMGLADIKAVIRDDLTDDKAFLLVALASNLRHGARMERRDIIAQMKRMQNEFGMSLSAIAKSLSLPKSTVANMLSGRDTNAARLSRDATANQRSQSSETPPKSLTTVPKEWRVAPSAHLTGRDVQRIEDAIGEALAADPSATLAPADVLAWAAQLQDARRQVMGKGVAQIAAFWAQVHRTFDAGERE